MLLYTNDEREQNCSPLLLMEDTFQWIIHICPAAAAAAAADNGDDDFNNFKWLKLFMTKVGHQ